MPALAMVDEPKPLPLDHTEMVGGLCPNCMRAKRFNEAEQRKLLEEAGAPAEIVPPSGPPTHLAWECKHPAPEPGMRFCWSCALPQRRCRGCGRNAKRYIHYRQPKPRKNKLYRPQRPNR